MTESGSLLLLKKYADEASEVRKAVVGELGPKILKFANRISAVIGSGGKILLAGNGGSAAEASHFAGEMVVRLTSARNRQALPALALNADTAVMTAAANDYGYENVFARQVEALGIKGDMLMVLSTSGNSENLLRAVHVAREKNMVTSGLLGGDGGKLGGMVDQPLIIPHSSTQRIQEEHLFLVHFIVEMVERDLFA